MSKVRLLRGDCLSMLNRIPDHSVDFILTDPPYGTTACKWDTVIPFGPMWEQIWRVLKPEGVVTLFGSEPFSSHLRMSQIKYFKYDWVWVKNVQTGISLSKYQPMRKHELISIFYRKCGIYFKQPNETKSAMVRSHARKGYKQKGGTNSEHHIALDVKKMQGKKFKTSINPNTILEFKTVNNRIKKHPTQKPVPLLEYLIKTYTLENETVLDFTMGSGSTGVACKNLNRNFIGIEKDKKYFEMAKTRIKDTKIVKAIEYTPLF